MKKLRVAATRLTAGPEVDLTIAKAVAAHSSLSAATQSSYACKPLEF